MQFVVDFRPFCKSCGVYNHFDDLIYELKGLSDIQAEVAGFETIRVGYALRAIGNIND